MAGKGHQHRSEVIQGEERTMRIGFGKALSVFVVAIIAAGFLFVSPGAKAASRTVALDAVLVGSEETPNPGDPDGRGSAVVLIKADQGELCYVLTVRRIETPHLAHIHRGAAGVAGPVVVHFTPPTPKSSDCLTGLDTELLHEIVDNPSGFYVNVHNPSFGSGAVRGQLG
jgi:hypothetical protein